jgi:hypothetical protein
MAAMHRYVAPFSAAVGIVALVACSSSSSSSSSSSTSSMPPADASPADAENPLPEGGGDAMPKQTPDAAEAGLPTSPPSDGHTPWAPAPGDPDWVDVTSFGAVGNAMADDTSAFRSAAATGKKIFVPHPPVAYKLTAFVQLASSIYGDGSMPEIRMYGADGDPDQGHTHNIFWIDQYTGSGLTISGLHLNGQWDGVGTNGEWSHDVHVESSKNVTVENSILEKPYGDCVFIGQYVSTQLSSTPDSIVVRNNVLSEPRRCNVAVSSGTTITIEDNTISKTLSTYVSAIDLEPDPLGYQHVDGVTIARNHLDVVALPGAGCAISMYDPPGNSAGPPCGHVTIDDNCGTWVPTPAAIDPDGIANYVGGTLPWSNVSVSNDVRGSAGCGANP